MGSSHSAWKRRVDALRWASLTTTVLDKLQIEGSWQRYNHLPWAKTRKEPQDRLAIHICTYIHTYE